ncbi:uncharacterized protein ATNIH1004_009260 [Aspergillus tanneri]|uniref:Uncharacterized protein n=1 Tax=Aspergillus tanneri TaxID=1220188 RepID=A0A5M9MKV0_9EURO|nr:uncharacterized protein ATNIH1004_009260 [Aspergillus tanneri]KAA8645049.1 hypothetical protein ATNIH1004_009260 [Aspergillus tanneri]
MDVPSFNSSSDSHTTSSQLPVLNPLYSDSYNGQNAPYGSTPAANHSLPGMSFYLSDLRNGHESSQPEPTVDNNSFDPFSSDPSISGALFTQFEADPAIMNTLFQS